MQRKAVIAIGLSVCLITASISGYLMFRSSTANDNQLNQVTQEGPVEANPDGIAENPSSPDDSSATSIADTMAEDLDQPSSAAPDDDSTEPSSDRRPHDRGSNHGLYRSSAARDSDDVDHKTRRRAADAVERIRSNARSYQPRSDQACNKKTTPAVHRASGVRYNFKNDCLPNGWVKVSERHGRGR